MCEVDATPWCRPAASERRRSPCALAWARLPSLGGVDRARPTLCLRCNVLGGHAGQCTIGFPPLPMVTRRACSAPSTRGRARLLGVSQHVKAPFSFDVGRIAPLMLP